MKKLTVLIAVILIAGLFSGCWLFDWLFPEEVTIPELDGIVSIGEWDDATEIPVAGDMGIVKVLAITDYLYVLFDVDDPTDARLGENTYGNDKIGLNINPTQGGSWGKPYDIVFQTGADPDAFTTPLLGGVSSGISDDWYTEWVIDGVQLLIPLDLETITIYSEGMRVSEWKVPLATILPVSGDDLKIGGAADNLGDSGGSYVYPIGLEWADVSTYVNIIVH